ncbi:hemerythrin domain-containing protein [Streptomyces althioticus]|jgi:hemerythrin superfamily protein|uniref:Hemerythrin domain-containing protein n=2 Tax=Streptomyces althioticus group TaxID=2867194 RepID=A0ABZ1YGQ0_9ACTN|nr:MULTISPECIES: hemerythrin domain-containing protein [Actinomycetes]WTB44819.1 hemerythrin domain-containing protein [Streptomyces althioticus]KEG38066.1 hemerythrin [Streptomyces griseorubens]MBM4826755.1 hemerythrin domain-containing protein [Actinospica acidiphila]WTB96600.1 hemerythrin domain-containing protein [Streptomyces althioticus]WTC21276.1 hemerythrin domain-containing protein [Streptomyces althioticus]
MSELETPQAGDDRSRDDDVVALLMRQHGDIRNLFDEVEATSGEERRDAFRRLVRLLAVHETAEEEVVHPFVRRSVAGGQEIVEDRLKEEREAKEMLATLDDMDPDGPDFLPKLIELRRDVQMHARAEERYEFIHIRRSTDVTDLAAMAKAIKAAEAMAPTRPHPGVESGAKNMALGPVAALMDRTKDTVRKAMGGS